jgi:hypothetical protein
MACLGGEVGMLKEDLSRAHDNVAALEEQLRDKNKQSRNGARGWLQSLGFHLLYLLRDMSCPLCTIRNWMTAL